jgi:2-polyprenyl-3-methyl-5-hydroxy-6-metoxy-1,4-benzoquinol methylase
VTAIDASEYAIDYAATAWSGTKTRLELVCGDVTAIPVDHGDADLIVSFETLEHLETPALFLKEVRRALNVDGLFVGSVPNLWVDASGKDPSPYHHHVFDRERLLATLSPYFEVRELWQQNAAHDLDYRAIPPRFHRIDLDGAGMVGKPEWLLFVAAGR